MTVQIYVKLGINIIDKQVKLTIGNMKKCKIWYKVFWFPLFLRLEVNWNTCVQCKQKELSLKWICRNVWNINFKVEAFHLMRNPAYSVTIM